MSVATTHYILKQKQMRNLGKMKVSEKEYFLIIEETKKELRDINQDHLINWSQN